MHKWTQVLKQWKLSKVDSLTYHCQFLVLIHLVTDGAAALRINGTLVYSYNLLWVYNYFKITCSLLAKNRRTFPLILVFSRHLWPSVSLECKNSQNFSRNFQPPKEECLNSTCHLYYELAYIIHASFIILKLWCIRISY